MRRPFVAVLASLLAVTSHGKVASVSPSGFDVRHEAEIAGATPARVYRALTREVGLWWHPDHTHSKSARNLSIDARPGGCFCEKLANGGAAEHMRVVLAMPGEVLRLQGALGPLQEAGLTGHLTWKLTPAGTATKVELSYSVGGHMAAALEKIAPAVDYVMGEQLARLESFLETGKPSAR